jgi:hypothetical protein
MIRHIVLFKLKDGLTRDDPRVTAASSALTALGPTLPPVLSWETHWCFGSRPVSHDFALICDVADEAGLAAYLTDPEHQKVAAALGEVFTLSVGDFELPG